MSTFSYEKYEYVLFDPQWKTKRKEILKRDENKCVICGSKKFLQIHHRQYHFSQNETREIDKQI